MVISLIFVFFLPRKNTPNNSDKIHRILLKKKGEIQRDYVLIIVYEITQ